jgi:hypothetical protein
MRLLHSVRNDIGMRMPRRFAPRNDNWNKIAMFRSQWQTYEIATLCSQWQTYEIATLCS